MMCMRVNKRVYCMTMEKYRELYSIYGVQLSELPEVWIENGKENKDL